MRDPPEDEDARDGDPVTTAYGVVARCNPSISRDTIEAAVSRLARTIFPNASIALGEDTDHGSLVSERPQPFVFLYVTESGRSFSFCRFRRFPEGAEFVFNLTESGRSSAELERYLTGSLSIEVVRRQLF
jgi:hypothetical protein